MDQQKTNNRQKVMKIYRIEAEEAGNQPDVKTFYIKGIIIQTVSYLCKINN